MKLSKYFIVNSSLFLLGTICLLFAPFSAIFSILAFLCLGSGFLMVYNTQKKAYDLLKQKIVKENNELIMELAVEDDNETYVYNKTKMLKQKNKQINERLKNKKLTLIALLVVGIGFVYFGIRTIFLII